MFLTLKTIAWDETRKGFYSPSQQGFLWQPGMVVVSQCPKCHKASGLLDLECTCGIYSSPNKKCLTEYAHYPNSIFMLMNNYGTCDIWTGPHDLPHTYVVRSWGAQIVGVIATARNDFGPRFLTSALATEFFKADIYSLRDATEMIRQNWEDVAQLNIFQHKEALNEYE